MIKENEYILSGRYQILKTLGQGSDGTVYLARHHSLETERAIKVFPKPNASSLFTISEANVLKSLQHPGIPTIYDLEEDECYYYLVEEYIQGESLEQFLLHQRFISQNLFMNLCEQICSIFHYLHTLPSPIVYQDLKPEHIIVCGLEIKLIDFSVSSFITNSGNDFKGFGNVAFSAPELFAGQPATFGSDIYSIGKIMDFLSHYVDIPLPQNLLTIIQKASNADPDLRFETVEDLHTAIQQANAPKVKTYLRQTIAVIGSHSGCGTTHIAISLVCALNNLGQTAIFYEKNATDCLRKAIPNLKRVWEEDGYYFSGCFIGLPQYGNGVLIPDHRSQFAILDYGTHISEELISADQILFVCQGAPWHRDDAKIMTGLPGHLKKRLKVIANLCDREAAITLAQLVNAPIYRYPYQPNPFKVCQESKDFARWLYPKKGDTGLFFHIKNHFSRNREP